MAECQYRDAQIARVKGRLNTRTAADGTRGEATVTLRLKIANAADLAALEDYEGEDVWVTFTPRDETPDTAQGRLGNE